MKSRENEMLALHEERQKREALERKLQEETQLREELVAQQIKYRERQKQQVRPIYTFLSFCVTTYISRLTPRDHFYIVRRSVHHTLI